MPKIDFSILLEPVAGATTLKDIALVSDLYSVAQQIKNIVLSNTKERPFNPKVGVNQDSLNISSLSDFDTMRYKTRVLAAILYLIKNITDIKVVITKQSYETLITVQYTYITTSRQTITGNSLTITLSNL